MTLFRWVWRWAMPINAFLQKEKQKNCRVWSSQQGRSFTKPIGGNKSQKITITFNWYNYDEKKSKYAIVKEVQGGGKRQLKMEKTTTLDVVFNQMEKAKREKNVFLLSFFNPRESEYFGKSGFKIFKRLFPRSETSQYIKAASKHTNLHRKKVRAEVKLEFNRDDLWTFLRCKKYFREKEKYRKNFQELYLSITISEEKKIERLRLPARQTSDSLYFVAYRLRPYRIQQNKFVWFFRSENPNYFYFSGLQLILEF